MEEIQPIVLDIGSQNTKFGFAGDDAPSRIFSSVVGKPRVRLSKNGPLCSDSHNQEKLKSLYVGDEAQEMRNFLTLDYPIQNGIITDWEDMENLLDYAFMDLDTSVHPILSTIPPYNPKQQEQKLTEILFEKYDTPATYSAIQAILAVYASGRCTATCLEIGDGIIHILTVYEGYTFYNAITRVDFGGRNLTDYLWKVGTEKGYFNGSTADREIAREIKENLCFISDDYEAELFGNTKRNYTLPSGETITLGKELFECPEILFKPQLLGESFPGIHQLVVNSIQTNPVDTQSDCYCNIVFSGGTTCFPGLADRMQREIVNLVPQTKRTKIIAANERKTMVWIGGSILASLSTFQAMWASRAEYDEIGVQVIDKMSII